MRCKVTLVSRVSNRIKYERVSNSIRCTLSRHNHRVDVLLIQSMSPNNCLHGMKQPIRQSEHQIYWLLENEHTKNDQTWCCEKSDLRFGNGCLVAFPGPHFPYAIGLGLFAIIPLFLGKPQHLKNGLPSAGGNCNCSQQHKAVPTPEHQTPPSKGL